MEIKKPVILVVDDDSMILSLTALILTRAGIQVIEAESGAMALEVFRKNPGIEAILTDVNCAKDTLIDGPSFVSLLKKEMKLPPVMFMSGNIGRYSESELVDLSDNPILWKPCSTDELMDAVWRLLPKHVSAL